MTSVKFRGKKRSPRVPHLPPFWEKLEQKNLRLIPYALIFLFLIIIYELFFHTENRALNLLVQILDTLIVIIFVIDLIFLARRAKNTIYFFKNYWLDILAIFPFALFFTLISRLYRALFETEKIIVGQALVHEGLEARKGFRFLFQSEKLGARAARFLRIGARVLRIITKSHLFQKFEHQRSLPKKSSRKTRK